MQATFVDSLALRVRNLAGAKGFNASTLGAALDIPSSSVANYWSGKRAWPTETLPGLAAKLGASFEHLMGGQPNGYADPVMERGAPLREQAADEVEVAEIDLRYGLGATYLDSHVETETRRFSRAWLRNFTDTPPEQLSWAKPQGNSMAPTINDGDMVLIDHRQKTPFMADLIWCFAFGQVGMIKRLRPMPDGSVKILSDNEAVPIETAHDDELHIIGRVVGVVKRV